MPDAADESDNTSNAPKAVPKYSLRAGSKGGILVPKTNAHMKTQNSTKRIEKKIKYGFFSIDLVCIQKYLVIRLPP